MYQGKKLTQSELLSIVHENDITSWEDFFGVDNPHFLPYWVAYMNKKDRLTYLQKHGSEFLDYSQSMLEKNYDWEQWKAKTE